MKFKFLVIGSNSFSGSHFIAHLISKNQNVLGVSRSSEINKVFLPYKWNKIKKEQGKFKFYKININKQSSKLLNLIKKFNISHIINFAAQGMVEQSWNSPHDWYQTNLLSQVNLFQGLIKLKKIKKYIHITTPEVYGSTKNWLKENFNFNPSTPYAISRAACDMHLSALFKVKKFPVIFTRASNVYGPGQQLYRIVPKTLISSISGKKISLNGGGKSRRSFIFIDDVCSAIYKILLYGKIGETYHISTNEIYSIKNLVKQISNLTSVSYKNLAKNSNERKGKDHAYLLDTSKIRKNLKWSDQINLNTGLVETLKWIKNNYSYLKKNSTEYKHKA